MGYVRKLVEYGHPTRLQLPFRMMAAGDKHASRAQGVGHFPVVLRVTHELKAVELRAEKEFGLKLYISSELNGRLRLYTDDAFRASMLRLYRDRIRPALKNHSSR